MLSDVAAKMVSDLSADDVLNSKELQQALITPGIIPPRREIGEGLNILLSVCLFFSHTICACLIDSNAEKILSQ